MKKKVKVKEIIKKLYFSQVLFFKLFLAKNLLEEIDVALFIEAVQNYEYLYNMSHRDYKDHKKKNLAWNEIGMIMNLTGKFMPEVMQPYRILHLSWI